MKFTRTKLFLVVLALLMLQCQKERDKYYAEPDWVGDPIYALLESKGRFDKYLQVVDKTMYRASFKGNGYWTVFAPNNDAMNEYLQEKGYGSVDDISVAEANKIVAYNMLYNKYVFDRLTDVLSGGWDTLQSIRKRTPYYEDLRRQPFRDGDSAWIVNPTRQHTLVYTERNYKYIPLYLQKIFAIKGLAAEDYNLFYPTTTYTGRNVQRASILEADMVAANGVVHEVNRVNEPLPTLEDILAERGSGNFSGRSYSRFKNLISDTKNDLGETYFINYASSPTLDEYYRKLYPSRNIDKVYVKFYSFDTQINCEMPDSEVGAETDGYTMFAPTDEAVARFETETLSPYGLTVETLTDPQKAYFIYAHLATSMVWPNQFKYSNNEVGCYINGEGKNGKGREELCIEQLPASNGFFYGVDSVIKSNYFETVFTEILLRPDRYLYMYQALRLVLPNLLSDLLMCRLNTYENEDYMVLLPTDDQLIADGFNLEVNTNGYYFTHSSTGGTEASVTNRLRHLVRSHVFRRKRMVGQNSNEMNTHLDDFSGNNEDYHLDGYDGYRYAINDYGDMVRYKDNKLEMIGNNADGEKVTPTFIKAFLNGKVYGVDKLLQYSPQGATAYAEDSVIHYIRKAAAANPNVSEAAAYFELFHSGRSDVLNYILGNGQSWTILLPTNAEMIKAYAPQYISPPGHSITYGSSTSNRIDSLMPPYNIRSLLGGTNHQQAARGLEKAIDFFRYHVIPGVVYVDDGYNRLLYGTGAAYEEPIAATGLKVDLIKSTFLKVYKDNLHNGENILAFVPYRTGVANPEKVHVVRGINRSNQFAPMGVIHEVNGFLRYVPEN